MTWARKALLDSWIEADTATRDLILWYGTAFGATRWATGHLSRLDRSRGRPQAGRTGHPERGRTVAGPGRHRAP
jgi:hypothetical protein